MARRYEKNIAGAAPIAILMLPLAVAAIFWLVKGGRQPDPSESKKSINFREMLPAPTQKQKVNASGVEFSEINEPFEKQIERYYGVRP